MHVIQLCGTNSEHQSRTQTFYLSFLVEKFSCLITRKQAMDDGSLNKLVDTDVAGGFWVAAAVGGLGLYPA
jgi:hypothetical protein